MRHSYQKAFTLVELLVGVVIIAVLVALAMPVAGSVLMNAKKVECMSNMRQIGMAIQLYTQDQQGRLPLNILHGGSVHFRELLKDYIDEHVEEVFACPADPRAADRIAAGSSSYLLNYWTSSVISNPLRGVQIDHTWLLRLGEPSSVPLLFIASDNQSIGPSNDHTHGNLWTSWPAVYGDVAVDRFRSGSPNGERTNGSTNILYADGRVEAITARDLKARFEADNHFSRPGN